MHRTRQEAEVIAHAKHGELQGYVLQVVASHYQRTEEWACQNCCNTGTVLKIKGIEVTTADCMCRVIHRHKQMTKSRLDSSLIPPLYHDADVAKWENPGRTDQERETNSYSHHVVCQYAQKIKAMVLKGHGLYLTGPNGVGKTYLGCSVGHKAASSGLDVKYYTMESIVRMQIDGWFNDEAKATAKGIRKADLLIIDDVDKIYRTKTDIEASLFDNLLRERLQSNRPCIFTSNRTIDDSREDFGPHIYSMLNEHCAELVFVGKDYRTSMSEQIKRDILDS